MLYRTIMPDAGLADVVREYWVIEDEQREPQRKKIIPDGYPEIIFHYGDPYRIFLNGEWETQRLQLFAGQITGHFFLENTGRSGMIGIKMMPAAAVRLAELDMSRFTDRVVPLEEAFGQRFADLAAQLGDRRTPDEQAEAADRALAEMVFAREEKGMEVTSQAVELIRGSFGRARIEELAGALSVTSRHLERLFKKEIGLSPKFYSRIVRFNRIFQIMKEGSASWIDLALDAGYYDQSHFIRDFKAFTGEEPGAYGFDEQTMANFFLNRDS